MPLLMACRGVLISWPAVAQHLAAAELFQAVGDAPDIVHAAAGQAAHADDLTLVQLEVEVLDPAQGHVLQFQRHFARVAGVVILAIILVSDLATHHHVADGLHRIRRVHLLAGQVADDVAVPQHRQVGALLQDLVHVVGDEHDGLALLRHAVDQLVQDLAALQGKSRGGLVHHQDLGLVGDAAHQLNQLAILESILVDEVAGLDMVDAEAFQHLLGVLLHLAHVDHAEPGELRLVAGKDILRHGDAGNGVGFLKDHGDARVLRFHHAAGVPGLPLV